MLSDWFWRITRTFGGRIPHMCVGAVAMLLFYLGFGPGHSSDVTMAVLVTVGTFLGAYLGAHRADRLDPWFPSVFSVFGQKAKDADTEFEPKRAQFVSFAFFCFSVYLVAYAVALRHIPLAQSGNWWLVVGISATTLGAQMFFCVRYASYLQMLVALDFVVKDTQPVRDSDSGLNQLKKLRNAVFRDEQLYEPPGNIFVTMGITATFLGLAIGLATLDLTAITQGAGNAAETIVENSSPAIEGNAVAAAAEGAKDLSSLVSFIGCMGLALGVSMLGVLMAMAAQWLRGYGPPETTEAILASATAALAPSEP